MLHIDILDVLLPIIRLGPRTARGRVLLPIIRLIPRTARGRVLLPMIRLGHRTVRGPGPRTASCVKSEDSKR